MITRGQKKTDSWPGVAYSESVKYVVFQTEASRQSKNRHTDMLTVIQSNLSKWIPLKGTSCLVPFRHNVKYKTWIGGHSV